MRVCTTPGCPTLVPTGQGQCRACTQARHRASNKRRPGRDAGYGTRWTTTRARQLARHPFCHDCLPTPVRAIEVHHLDGRGPSGPRGHDPTNLMSLCGPCHSRRTTHDQPGGWHANHAARATGSMVVITGPPGVGKTAVTTPLAHRLGVPRLGPDDHDDRWAWLLPTLDAAPHAIIECGAIHRGLRQRINTRPSTIIELTARPTTLARRLRQRGEPQSFIDRVIGEAKRPAYGADIPRDATIDAEQPVEAVTGAVEAVLRRSGWGGTPL